MSRQSELSLVSNDLLTLLAPSDVSELVKY